jgi:hypothetical protein
MKKIYVALAVIMLGCKESADTVKDFISGTYVRFAAGEYSKAWDTLRVDAYDLTLGTYVIEQCVGFQRMVDGKLQPREYLRKKTTAVMDEQTHQLQDRKTGKYYTFSPERGTLLAGSAEYVKIK